MKKRHFIVFYKALSKDGDQACSHHSITATDGNFLNYELVSKHIKKELQEKSPNKVVKSICITNLIELNEIDYKNWVG